MPDVPSPGVRWPVRHPYKMFRRLEEIKHGITKIKQPQSRGIDERFHRATVLGEHLVQYNTRRLPLDRNVSGGCRVTTVSVRKIVEEPSNPNRGSLVSAHQINSICPNTSLRISSSSCSSFFKSAKSVFFSINSVKHLLYLKLSSSFWLPLRGLASAASTS